VSVPTGGPSDVEGIVWPPLLVGDSAQLAALVTGLEGTQWCGRTELEAAQGEQLGRLALHLSRHSPAFAARLRSAGLSAADLGRIDRLASLPVLRRRQLQEAGADFFARQVPKGHQPIGQTKTSGSTGEPVTVQRTQVCRLFWAACTVRDHLWQGRDFAGRMTSIRPTNPPYVELEDWGYPVA